MNSCWTWIQKKIIFHYPVCGGFARPLISTQPDALTGFSHARENCMIDESMNMTGRYVAMIPATRHLRPFTEVARGR